MLDPYVQADGFGEHIETRNDCGRGNEGILSFINKSTTLPSPTSS